MLLLVCNRIQSFQFLAPCSVLCSPAQPTSPAQPAQPSPAQPGTAGLWTVLMCNCSAFRSRIEEMRLLGSTLQPAPRTRVPIHTHWNTSQFTQKHFIYQLNQKIFLWLPVSTKQTSDKMQMTCRIQNSVLLYLFMPL